MKSTIPNAIEKTDPLLEVNPKTVQMVFSPVDLTWLNL